MNEGKTKKQGFFFAASLLILFPQKFSYFPLKIINFPQFSEKKNPSKTYLTYEERWFSETWEGRGNDFSRKYTPLHSLTSIIH